MSNHNNFVEQKYNPDILNTFSNLSNDEVFTPPEVVNQMLDLLPKELWSNKNAKFLDPVTKSGVFLREIAKRLNEGLEKEFPNRDYRVDHILSNQLYGIAITELTSLFSRRSLYCSKFANSRYSIFSAKSIDGNIRFKRVEHLWVGDKCQYCNASKKELNRSKDLENHAYEFIHTKKVEELFNMKFDVIIGNPPYQLKDGGAKASAAPIYHKFVQQAIKLNPRYLVMITPSRWFSGGKNLTDFRRQMLLDNSIRTIHDFLDARECFPGVEIKGGVSYFLWDRDNKGHCKVFTHQNNVIVSIMERPLVEKNTDIFIRYNDAIKILHKIQEFKQISFSTIVNSAMVFGFRTYFKDYDSLTPVTGYIKVYGNKSVGYIKPERITKSIEFIDKWKVILPEAIGSGDMQKDKINPIISEPFSINTETYVMNGPYVSEQEAKNVISYINTRFFSFLLGLKKISQHTTQNVYEFIPMQDFSLEWSDDKLFKKYNFTSSEIDYILSSTTKNLVDYDE